MNLNLFERLLVPAVIVMALALGGVMAFATSFIHSASANGGGVGAG